MRHDAHYVEQLTSFSGAAVGRMIPIDKIRPNPDQPRKVHRRYRASFPIPSGRRACSNRCWFASCPAKTPTTLSPANAAITRPAKPDCKELPCIEKIADDAETLELALIENLQRKDLTAFEEADGLYRLAEQFAYTHEDIARKIAKARSSVTETLSLRNIPEAIRRQCVEHGIVSKSLLLQIARQPNEKKMAETLVRIIQGGLTRDEARRERRDEKSTGPRPQPFIFNFEPESEAFRLRIQFRKSNVSRQELIYTLRAILDSLENENADAASGPAVA